MKKQSQFGATQRSPSKKYETKPIVCISLTGICETPAESRIIAGMAPGAMIDTGYTYKASPYSSHTLLVASLPAEGRGKRVLDIGCAGGYLAAILARRGYQVVGVERPGAQGDAFPDDVELVETDLE